GTCLDLWQPFPRQPRAVGQHRVGEVATEPTDQDALKRAMGFALRNPSYGYVVIITNRSENRVKLESVFESKKGLSIM
ncbi:MAG: hypothetical protein WBC11_02775, partial [Dehalococcoidia bacterium]